MQRVEWSRALAGCCIDKQKERSLQFRKAYLTPMFIYASTCRSFPSQVAKYTNSASSLPPPTVLRYTVPGMPLGWAVPCVIFMHKICNSHLVCQIGTILIIMTRKLNYHIHVLGNFYKEKILGTVKNHETKHYKYFVYVY